MSHEVDPVATVILWATLIFVSGVAGRNVALRLKLPGVLGELLMGVLLGNVCYYFGVQLFVLLREGSAIYAIMAALLKGSSLSDSVAQSIHDPYYAKQVILALSSHHGNDLLKVSYVVDIFSRYGVIFLLFLVGVDSSVAELKRTGRESTRVAIIGVLAPMLLGLLAMLVLMPDLSFKSDLFIAATLSATSIGITARALGEMKVLQTREAKTILGAAVIDDILGLMMLAVVSSIVMTGVIDLYEVARIIFYAGLFFAGSLFLGPMVLKKLADYFNFFEPWEEKLFISFVFMMMLSWLATLAGLASIIGAFAAGLIIHDNNFRKSNHDLRNALSIRELLAPLEAILVPLFFMLIGIQVKLEAFMSWQVLLLATALTVAAILGKLVSGLGASRKDDCLFIGIGMLPRGEVGLVFASIGRSLGVISDELFSAVILMVIITTLITPPWLALRQKVALMQR